MEINIFPPLARMNTSISELLTRSALIFNSRIRIKRGECVRLINVTHYLISIYFYISYVSCFDIAYKSKRVNEIIFINPGKKV